MFKKKDAKISEDFRREAIAQPEIIEITVQSLKEGLSNYIISLKSDIEIIAKECGIRVNTKNINETSELLFNVCLFFMPSAFENAFNNKNISDKYLSFLLSSVKDRMDLFKHFTQVYNEHKMNQMMLFPFLLAIKNKAYFEQILKEAIKTREISGRAISFTYDFTEAFCRSNPFIEGFLGDCIARESLKE